MPFEDIFSRMALAERVTVMCASGMDNARVARLIRFRNWIKALEEVGRADQESLTPVDCCNLRISSFIKFILTPNCN